MSGQTTFRVTEPNSAAELRTKLLLAANEQVKASFVAVSQDDPSETPEPHKFIVCIYSAHFGREPAMDVIDEDSHIFQIDLSAGENGPAEFTVHYI